MPHSTLPRRLRIIRIISGILFILAGLFKFLLPILTAGLAAGPESFGAMLSLLRVPLALLWGYVVPGVELIGGLGLILNRGVRLWAILLAIDMVAAMVLVGLPGVLGHPLMVGTTKIGSEVWRLPLEFTLLLAMLWLASAAATDKNDAPRH